MIDLFFSYSHRDEELRNELEKHLSMLKRQGLINAWHDRRITVGSEIDNDISKNLESSEVILLLVSSDFLASDYCYGREMERAMEKHEARESIVIPVILRPCDWQSALFGKLCATPTDGKAVSMYANPDEAFSIIAKDIRKVVENFCSSDSAFEHERSDMPRRPTLSDESLPRSSNLRMKRQFSDHEKDDFLEDSFNYITRFFKGSLQELEKRNPQIKTKLQEVSANRFTATIYENGNLASICTIWLGAQSPYSNSKSIFYSSSESVLNTGYSETICVGDNGYTLHLNPMMGMMMDMQTRSELSKEGAAEYYWKMLIRSLQ